MSPAPRGRTLVLVRHGRTAWNADGRAQGQGDVELDDLGHAQARAVAPYLASLRPAVLRTSDLARARQTAEYVARASGLEAEPDKRLREYDVGARQGMTLREFAREFPAEHASWVAGDDAVPLPGAETTGEVVARMVPALQDCLGDLADGETGVVVTHGACLKVTLVALLGWPGEVATGLRGVDNCGWVVLSETTAGGPLRLEVYNGRTGAGGDGAVDL